MVGKEEIYKIAHKLISENLTDSFNLDGESYRWLSAYTAGVTDLCGSLVDEVEEKEKERRDNLYEELRGKQTKKRMLNDAE